MFKLHFSILSSALAAVAQTAEPAQPPPVTVPTFANSTCPIMGKKVSMALFVDTDVGRFWVCCKPCYKKILADLPAAHKTAYPVVKTIANDACPVSGEPIGEHKTALTLQGFQFDLCCAGCVDAARSNSQIVLSKLEGKGVRDLGNATCPVTDKPTVDNAFVVIGDTIVRLAAPADIKEIGKDARGILAKAVESAKKQPAKPPHVHRAKEERGDQDGKNEKPGEKSGEEKGTEQEGGK